MNRPLSHSPRFIDASAAGTERASASISAMVCSATLTLLAPGAFMTTMPRALAASTSTLSTPVPARAISRSRGAASISDLVTRVALRTISASASARSPARASAVRPARASIVQPGSRSGATADSGSLSAMTIFMVW